MYVSFYLRGLISGEGDCDWAHNVVSFSSCLSPFTSGPTHCWHEAPAKLPMRDCDPRAENGSLPLPYVKIDLVLLFHLNSLYCHLPWASLGNCPLRPIIRAAFCMTIMNTHWGDDCWAWAERITQSIPNSKGYLQQAELEQYTEGTHKLEEPVSKRTVNCCGGVPM